MTIPLRWTCTLFLLPLLCLPLGVTSSFLFLDPSSSSGKSSLSPFFIRTTTRTSCCRQRRITILSDNKLSSNNENYGDNDDDNKNYGISDDDSTSSKQQQREENIDLFLPLAGSAVLVVAFWPLFALFFNDVINDPTSGFDIDMFLSLKSILDTSSSVSATQSSFDNSNIVELPSLSPGERIVGIFFGSGSPTSKFGDFNF